MVGSSVYAGPTLHNRVLGLFLYFLRFDEKQTVKTYPRKFINNYVTSNHLLHCQVENIGLHLQTSTHTEGGPL